MSFMFPTAVKPLNGVAIKGLVLGLQNMYPEVEQTVLHISDLFKEDLGNMWGEGYSYYRIKPPRLYKLFHFYNEGKIEAVLKDKEYDMVHFHNFFPGVFLLEKFLEKRKLPYLITFRGSCARALRFMYRRGKLKKLLGGAGAWTFLSEYFFENIVERLWKFGLPLKEERTYFIPNFKTVDWAKNTFAGHIGKVAKLLVIANVEARKNLETTILAVKEVQKTRAVTLDIYGEIYDAKIYNRIKGMLDHSIVFHHAVPNDKLKRIIDEHAMLILLAHLETFGMAYIESILRDRPVVYARKAGITSFIRDKRFGLGVEDVHSIEEIAETIHAMIDGYGTFEFGGKEMFLEGEVVPQWMAIYRKVVGKG